MALSAPRTKKSIRLDPHDTAAGSETAPPPAKDKILACVSGAVCQVMGLGLMPWPVSSLYVDIPRVGGISSAPVPYGSLSCQLLFQFGPQVPCSSHPAATSCSDQLIDPRPRFQPSPTQGAADCGLCCSATAALLYPSWRGGVRPPGPWGRSMGYEAVSDPALRSTLKGSGLPNVAIGEFELKLAEVL